MTPGRERGTTLIEMLAATVILSVISFALTEAVVSGFRNTGDTQDRLVGSIDRQRVTAAFVPDVQSADPFDSSTTDACGDTNPAPEEGIKFGWTDGSTEKLSTYLELTDGVERQLVRRYCENGSIIEEGMLAEYRVPSSFGFQCSLGQNQCSLTVPSTPKPFTIVAERRAA